MRSRSSQLLGSVICVVALVAGLATPAFAQPGTGRPSAGGCITVSKGLYLFCVQQQTFTIV